MCTQETLAGILNLVLSPGCGVLVSWVLARAGVKCLARPFPQLEPLCVTCQAMGLECSEKQGFTRASPNGRVSENTVCLV